jgi:hypothetical protein
MFYTSMSVVTLTAMKQCSAFRSWYQVVNAPLLLQALLHLNQFLDTINYQLHKLTL